MSDSKSSTTRFSDRVADYVRYRPGYPRDMVRTLQEECALNRSSVVADVGSGTGISTELFLDLGCHVNAIEPNDAMRAAAEDQLGDRPGFRSLNSRAEATGLPDNSQDFVSAGQAFHWFANVETKAEFKRILKPDGQVALFWNERLTTGSRFLAEYEQLLLEFAPDYSQVNHVQITKATIERFLGTACCQWDFKNSQLFDFEGLKGRLLSSSYAPNDGVAVNPMLDELRRVFDRNVVDGRVSFEYATKLYVGSFGEVH